MKKLISIILSMAMLTSVFGGMSIVVNAGDYDTIVYVSSNTAYKDHEFTYYIELDGQPYSPNVFDKDDKDIAVKDGYFKLKGDNTALVSFDREGSYTIKRMATTIGDNELVEAEQSGKVEFKYSKSVDGIISFLTEDEYNTQTENGTKISATHYLDEKGEICDADTIAPCTYYPAGSVLNEEIDDCYYDTAKATVIPVKYTFTTTHATETGKLGDRHKYSGTVSTSTTKVGYITSLANNETFSTVSIVGLQLAQTQAYGLINAIVGTHNNKIVEALTPEGAVGRNVVLTAITPEASSLVSTDATKVDNVIVNYCVYTRLEKCQVNYSKYLQPSKDKVQFSDKADATVLKLGKNSFSVDEDGTDFTFTPKESDIYAFTFSSDKEMDSEILLNEDFVRDSMYDYKDKTNFVMAARLEANKKYTIPVSSYDGETKISLNISRGHPYKFESVTFDLTHALTVIEKKDGILDDETNTYYYFLYASDMFKKGDKMIFTTTDGEKVVYEYDKDKYAFVCGDSQIDAYNIEFYDEQEKTPWTEPGAHPVTMSSMLMSYDTNVYLIKATQLIHDYAQVVTNPTCTTDGYTTNTCSTCGATYISDIVFASHTLAEPVEENRVEPTCSAAGSYDMVTYCTVCTKEISRKQESIPTIAHTYKKTTTKATTSKNGSIVEKCTACGDVKSKTTIYYPKTVTLSATSYVYDGKAKKPTVTVKDSNGNKISSSYYDVAYTNNTKVGKATVKVTFKTRYTGSISKTFAINPKGTSLKTLTATKGGFKATWTKQATQTTGYEIQIATDSAFKKNVKSYTVSKNATTSKSISSLTKGKKYYVRIRTYKTVSSTKYYSSWSGSKTVTTKK